MEIGNLQALANGGIAAAVGTVAHQPGKHPVFLHRDEGCAHPGFSERVLQRRIEEVTITVAPGFFDKSAAGKEAVARVALQMTGEVVSREQVGLRADIARMGAVCRPEHGGGLIVDAVTIGGAPEQVLLERERKIVYRAYGNTGVRSDDVLPADVIDIAKIRMAVREELIESADAAAGLPVSARIVELEVGPGRPLLDGKSVAEHGREHASADISRAHRAELAGSFQLKIPIRLSDLAPRAQSKSMPILSSGGRVESRRWLLAPR